jgi:hypothetical protein
MNLREIGGDSVDCIHLTLQRDTGKTVVDTVINLRVPLDMVNFLTSSEAVSLSRRTSRYVVNYFPSKADVLLIAYNI